MKVTIDDENRFRKRKYLLGLKLGFRGLVLISNFLYRFLTDQ